MKAILCLLLVFICFPTLFANEGRFINPITDVCWDCLFPITVGGVNVTPGHRDSVTYHQRICTCAGIPPKVGIPLTFWEPTRLVDVTRHAYKLVGMGGITIGQESIKNRGSIGIVGDGPSQSSFYHVHWYFYPLISWLEILTDFACIEQSTKFDVEYISELDPFWNDDHWNAVTNPEGALFGNPAAQLACIADCTATSFHQPLDKLFWCAGCAGSLYPFTGTVSHHQGGIQASSLLVHRIIAKLHRCLLLKGFDEDNFCEPRLMPILKKSLYRTQLVYPIPEPQGPCHQLGESSLIWGAGKSFPQGGEDFVYLIWRKKHCCLDAVKASAAGAGI